MLVAFAAAAADAPRSYTPEDFARYAPRTALDMLRLVPGFVIRRADQVRGLGQASGNVLLNGERVAGKDSDVLDELGRIPAANVLRIELVDAATLDVPGLSGQVANVIVRADMISGRWSYEPEWRRHFTDPVLTRGEISVTGAAGALEYGAGLSNSAGSGAAGGLTRILNPDGTLRELRDETWVSTFDGPRVNARIGYTHAGGAASQVNASYQRIYYDFDEHGHRSGPGLPDAHPAWR
jgi:outer membrane receptor for ferrienterochelin and colicins